MRFHHYISPSRLHTSRPSLGIFAIVAALAACSSSGADSVAPTSNGAIQIAITPDAPSVALGSQVALQADVRDGSGQTVPGTTIFWSSSDTSIVTVSSSGVVTGMTVGTAQVAASAGGQSAVVPVTVVPVAVAAVTILPSSASVSVGGNTVLRAVAYDANGQELSGRAVVWASSATQTASVDATGKVTGVAAGTATITGTIEGITASATVTVTLVPVATVIVTPGSASLIVGHTASLSAVATDANGNVLDGRQITWSSANTAIATVSEQGLVTAVDSGATTVIATAEGKTGAAQIVVTADPNKTPVASVSITPPTATMAIGGTVTLSATALDDNGNVLTGRTVAWSSATPSVATVDDNGVVTAASAGTTMITATVEGRTATAQITVTPPAVASVEVNPASFTLRTGRSRTLKARVFDSNGDELSGRTVTWSSSNILIALVTPGSDSSASVLALAHGTATITVTCEGVTGTATVTVAN